VLGGIALLGALPAVVGALPVPDSGVGAAVLRARILASARVPYQGYAESTVNLGIPGLPVLSDVATLLDGTTAQYVWYRSPAHWRADVVTAAGEDDTYRDGGATYLWDYSQNLLTKVVGTEPARLPRAADLLPPALGRRLLGLAAGTGRISRLPSRRIAGLAAAGLQVRATDPRSLVAAVDIWADPVTGLPAAVQVFARNSRTPALDTRFLQLTRSRPPLSVVTPDPAPGVIETTAELPDVSGILAGIGPPLPASLAGFPRVQVDGGLASVAAYGTGYSRFAVIPLPGRLGSRAFSTALHAGATELELPAGDAAQVRTPLLTVALARSRFGGPVFLLAGPVVPAVVHRAAAAVMTRAVILP
jgi:hypothetical protein